MGRRIPNGTRAVNGCSPKANIFFPAQSGKKRAGLYVNILAPREDFGVRCLVIAFLQATCRRRNAAWPVSLRAALDATLPGRLVGQAKKAATSRRTPKRIGCGLGARCAFPSFPLRRLAWLL